MSLRRSLGQVIHVRQGQLVKITLTNNGAISHSVDFHAARIAPNKAFTDVMPGKSASYTFRANDAAVPSLDTDLQIVGTILNTAYAVGDMNPRRRPAQRADGHGPGRWWRCIRREDRRAGTDAHAPASARPPPRALAR